MSFLKFLNEFELEGEPQQKYKYQGTPDQILRLFVDDIEKAFGDIESMESGEYKNNYWMNIFVGKYMNSLLIICDLSTDTNILSVDVSFFDGTENVVKSTLTKANLSRYLVSDKSTKEGRIVDLDGDNQSIFQLDIPISIFP